MPWIDVVEPEEATGQLVKIYEDVDRRRGSIANIYKIHSLNPRALQAHLDLYMSILYRRKGLKRAQREMIAVVVSALNHCDYCVIHHSEALARYEKSSKVLQGLQTDYRKTPLPEKEARMLEYCAKLTQNPETVKERDAQKLKEVGFDDSEILDINLIASYFNFVNRVVLGLDVDLEIREEREYRY